MKPRTQHAQSNQPQRVLAALSRPAGVRLLLFCILAVSLFVRCYGLTCQGLECEELYTLLAATGHQYVYLHTEPGGVPLPLPFTLQDYRQLLVPEAGHGLKAVTGVLARNVHLPFYFFFMHYWVAAFGSSEGTLRLPSIVWSTLAVCFLFLLGQELFTPWIGLLAAQSLDEALGGASDVWVLISGENQVVRLLEADGFRRSSIQVLFGHVLVSRYSKQPV